MDDFIVFSGTANPPLAQGVVRELGGRLGACAVERFPGGELSVRLEEPVRGREVFILQPTSPPVNEHLVELLAFADACRRASAAHVTAIAETKVTHLVGEVRGRPCLIVDDMISTGGTIAESVEALLAAGARPEITVAVTHGLLLTGARDKPSREGAREVLVTDTVPVNEQGRPRSRVISVAPLLAAALRCFLADGSLSDLY